MKKIIIFGGVGVLVVIIGIVAAVFFLNQEPKVVEVSYLEFPLGEQYTNIAVPEGETPSRKPVLKYKPVIQYTNEELTLSLTANQTLLLNEFRKYFMSRNAVQLSRLDRVQEDLKEIAIEILKSTSEDVTNVFFLEFIIQ